jgi:pyruvate/2-oxoglutarate/acetoin dehydrogenase E1 component
MRELTYAEAAVEVIREEMEKDTTIFYMGEDVGRFGGVYGTTKGLWERFGEDRVKDTPMSEAAIIGYALGAAITGMRIIEAAFDYLDSPVKRIAAHDVPVPFSPPLEDFVVPTEEKIAAEIKKIVRR